MVRTMRLTGPMTGNYRASVEGWTVDRQGDWDLGSSVFGRQLDRNRQWKRSGNAVEMSASSKDKEEEGDGGRWKQRKQANQGI